MAAAAKKTKAGRGKGRPTTKGSVGKAALIAAVREALKRKPPGEITLNEVSQIAGVDPALIRYYFGQLPDLFIEAAAEITRELRGKLAALIAMKGSVRERLHQRVNVYLQVFRDNPHYHRLIIDSVHRGDSPTGQAILKLLRHSVDELEELLREGVASGELKPLDARMLQLAIAAMCEFFFSARSVFQAVFGAETDDPEFVERYSHFMTDLISDSRQRTPMRDTRQRPLLRRLK